MTMTGEVPSESSQLKKSQSPRPWVSGVEIKVEFRLTKRCTEDRSLERGSLVSEPTLRDEVGLRFATETFSRLNEAHAFIQGKV